MHIGRLGVLLGRGRLRARGRRHRRHAAGRGAVARRQAHRGVAHVERAAPPRDPARHHRDDRLADGGRVVRRWAPDLPARDGPAPRPAHRARARSSPRCKYVRTYRGEFVYRDYGSNWSAVARNLDITLMKAADYRGVVRFSDSTVTIQDFVPMSARACGSFKLNGTQVFFDKLDLVTDGAVTRRHRRRRSRASGPSRSTTSSRASSSRRCVEIFFASNTFDLSATATSPARSTCSRAGAS